MIEQEKLEKIKAINNDDSDMILKFIEYANREIPKVQENVFNDSKEFLENRIDKDTLYLLFSRECSDLENVYTFKSPETKTKYIDEELYYSGKRYDEKINSFCFEEEIKNKVLSYEKVQFVFDVSLISSLPIWETKMLRRIKSVLKGIENTFIEELNKKKLHTIIKKAKRENIENEGKYDLDFIIYIVKEVVTIKNASAVCISNQGSNQERFLSAELLKLVKAANMNEEERKNYIYDTAYNDMNSMFSRFGFCNFKENKCVSQRHKNLFNRYPVPKTDGCCFKVVRKCEHNNKDGTCKVECLPCKLFTCPYLGKLDLGFRTGEIILLRAFLTMKQRRLLIYKFYKPKKFFMERL